MGNVAKKRNIEVDIVKGIAIILMVVGHATTNDYLIYLFHMPVFFIASGYFYKDSASDSIPSVMNYTIKKFKGLWFPYALWTGIFSILRNFFIDINVYTNNPLVFEHVDERFAYVTEYWRWQDVLLNIVKGCILPGNAQVGGALWFLATLLQITVGYCVIDFILKQFVKKEHILIAQGIVSIVLLAIGYLFCVFDIWLYGIERFFSCYCLFYIGILLGKVNDKVCSIKASMSAVIVVFCFGLLCVLNKIGYVSLSENDYSNPVFMLTASLAGWFLLFESAALMKKIRIAGESMAYVGKNTLCIVILHLLAFKIVSLIGVLIRGDELYCISGFPILYDGPIWCLLYTIVGVSVPLGLNAIYKRVKRGIINGNN